MNKRANMVLTMNPGEHSMFHLDVDYYETWRFLVVYTDPVSGVPYIAVADTPEAAWKEIRNKMNIK